MPHHWRSTNEKSVKRYSAILHLPAVRAYPWNGNRTVIILLDNRCFPGISPVLDVLRAIIEEYLSAHNALKYTEIPGYPAILKRKPIWGSYMKGSAYDETKLHMACAPKNKTTGVAG